jgi:hypothetical protein
MATLRFNIPDADMPRVLNAWGVNWSDQVLDESTGQTAPNPQTKQAFARQEIRKMIAERVRSYEATQAQSIDITDG